MSKEALSEIQGMIDKQPDDSVLVATKLRIMSDLGQLNEGIEISCRYLARHPNNISILRERAVLYSMLGDNRSAIQDVTEALKIDEQVGVLWMDRGIYYWQLNLYNDALECFNKGVLLEPDRPSYWMKRGDYYREQMNDMNNACADYERAAQMGNSEAARRMRKYCTN